VFEPLHEIKPKVKLKVFSKLQKFIFLTLTVKENVSVIFVPHCRNAIPALGR